MCELTFGVFFVVVECVCFCRVAVLEEAVQKAKTEELRIPFGVGIAGWVAQNKEAINLRNAYEVSLTKYASDGTSASRLNRHLKNHRLTSLFRHL